MSSATKSYILIPIFTTVIAIIAVYSCRCRRRNRRARSIKVSVESNPGYLPSVYESLIGHTPLVKLYRLSLIIGRDIYVKMESLNPGGTGKDRAVKYMLKAAMNSPSFKKGMPLVEGSSGSTGISLAVQCRTLGIPLHVVMPEDQALEKRALLERLGAIVSVVPCCSIANENHYVNQARRLAEDKGGIFIDQFENLANTQAHYQETGPEIWNQCKGRVDAFVMSAGTGGTLAGVSRYLKERNSSIRVVLADPQGSSLHHRVRLGVCYTSQQQERRQRRHRIDSIAEGIGLDRITRNFEQALIDDSESVPDQEAVDMAHWLLANEGLFVGSSSSINIVAACRVARKLEPEKVVITVVCDSGHRHLSRFWNRDFVETCEFNGQRIRWPSDSATCIPACLKFDSRVT